jgi:hypothetical protein
MRRDPIEAEQATTITVPARLARITAEGGHPHARVLHFLHSLHAQCLG